MIFSVGWNRDFFEGNLKNFWGSGSQRNFDESFVGFSWALGQAGWFWDLGARFILTRNTKFDFPVTLGHQKPKTKN